MAKSKSRERSVWKGAVAGAAAGLVATWAMTNFQNAWSKLSEEMERERHGERFHSPERGTGEQEKGDDATMKTADRIARTVLNRELTKEEKSIAAPFVHYGFGAVTGALYGAIAEPMPAVTVGQGGAYASAVFVLGDEIAVPALGLSGPITETPISVHLYAWLSHLVYGFTLERTRRGIRALMSGENLADRLASEFRETEASRRFRRAA